jgi:hypothetical protein
MVGHRLQDERDLTDRGGDDHYLCLPDPRGQIAGGAMDSPHADCILPGVGVRVDAGDLTYNLGSTQGHTNGSTD